MIKIAGEQEAEIIRNMIRHENELINHRILWLIQIEGLLFVALASVLNCSFEFTDEVSRWFASLFSIMGLIIAISAAIVLSHANHAIGELHDWWEDRRSLDYSGVGVIGLRRTNFVANLAPWRIVPYVFIIGWIVMLMIIGTNKLESANKKNIRDVPELRIE